MTATIFRYEMDENIAEHRLTRRVIACPRCGRRAEAVLRWHPDTAWRASLHLFQCSRGCGVPERAVLEPLGLA